MVRINCHSAFKHYEMFHSNHCGGSNYGSIFNTTYNISCGNNGSHGGFWSGFGAGLGNAFGGLFTNMLGGGMNFGGMGLWGGGMMPWFNSIGNNGGWWGNNANNTNNTNNNTSNSPVDKDNEKYNELEKDVNKLLGKADKPKSKEKAKELYNEIKELYEKPLDPMNENMNKGAYHDLMTKLEAKFPELNGKDNTSSEPTSQTTSTTTAAPPTPAPATSTTATTPSKIETINSANSLDELLKTDYNDLSDTDKEAYKKKAIQLAHDNSTTPAQLREILNQIKNPDLRIAIKESFYETGYSNVEKNKITADLLSKLKNVIDASKIPDFKDVTLGNPTQNTNDKWTIPVLKYKDDKGNVHQLNVPYVEVEVVDGEVIFHGKQLTQKYVLQTDGNNLHLMQYKYHEGYGKGDVTSKKK